MEFSFTIKQLLLLWVLHTAIFNTVVCAHYSRSSYNTKVIPLSLAYTSLN